jgi:MFS family permease
MKSALKSLGTLFAASFFVQFTNAAITTMIAIVIALRGGEQSDVALIAGCYSLGFALGCFLAPRQAVRVGMIRFYAGSAAIYTITILGLELLEGVALWAFLRFCMGVSIAAVLAVSDAWINGRVTSGIRGRVIAVYAIVLGTGSILSQLTFLLIGPTADAMLPAIAIMMNIAVVLVVLSPAAAPTVEAEGPKRLFSLTISSGPSIFASFVAGFCIVSIISIVPFYLTEYGVRTELVILFPLSFYLGRLVFQWPVGLISDRLDRRTLLTIQALAVFVIMLVMALSFEGQGVIARGERGLVQQILGFLLTLVLGGMLSPIYSVAVALAFDRAEGKSRIHISTTLLLAYSIGSVVGPVTVMAISWFAGDVGLHIAVMVACGALALVGLLRRITVAAPVVKTKAVEQVIDTSVAMARSTAKVSKEQPAPNQNEQSV